MSDHTRPIIAEREPLSNGYEIAWCVAHDGSPEVWLVANLCACCEDTVTHGNASPASAPHEQDGPLPEHVRRRLEAHLARCGRPRTDGRPCRASVPRPGDACRWHGKAAR